MDGKALTAADTVNKAAFQCWEAKKRKRGDLCTVTELCGMLQVLDGLPVRSPDLNAVVIRNKEGGRCFLYRRSSVKNPIVKHFSLKVEH